MTATFDSVLDDIDNAARAEGIELGEKDAFLRDIYGRVALYLATKPDSEKQSRLASAMRALGPYVRQERTLLTAGDSSADAILSDSTVQWVRVPTTSDRFLRIVERRVVGADWVARPRLDPSVGPQRIVFASMKGGVGRSTALCVSAYHLARRGKQVLVIDLDLEAPGVGGMLTQGSLPSFGVVDILAAAPAGAALPLAECCTSVFVDGTHPLDVVPAYGETSRKRPENYLAKLGRALADVSVGDAEPLHVRVASMVDRLCEGRGYDVVLIDARAGLSEITAGAIVSLGATVLLFGTAQTQSLEDYRFLFAHLASLAEPGKGPIWKHLVPVLAKAAPGDQNVHAQEQMFEHFETYFYEEQPGLDEVYHFGLEDENAPHRFVPIAFSSAFATFDPQQNKNAIDDSLRDPVFQPFLEALDGLVDAPRASA